MNLFSNNTKKNLVILCCALSSMQLYAQYNSKVTIKTSNISLQKALTEVQKQTNMSISYNNSALPKEKISLNINNKSVDEALTEILKNSGLSYVIKDDYIMIIPEEKKNTIKDKTVSGRITDVNGEPLVGVTIVENGTTNGTITDFDGNYSLTVSSGSILNYSYIGYNTVTRNAANGSVINLTMKEDTKVLEEVVVTALGIKRSEKALSYNVQQVNADDITKNKDANFVNSLSGKVAGVNINASSSGTGGVSKVVMRGTKSIMQSSNALYVIDGVPMFTKSVGQQSEFNSQGNTDLAADINPEDIESMSVLTGAAAAALYGSEAANGAIVITTKKGKEGKLNLTFNSNTEFQTPFIMPQFQNRYGTGSNGVYGTSGARSWGALLNDDSYYGYDPAKDYFQTGIVGTESLSLSVGNERNQTYASVAAVNSKGITPNNKYNRYNFTVRNTTSFLNDKMTLDVSASYILQNDRNMTTQGTYNNPIVGAYLFPRGNDWEDIRMYERYDPARKLHTQFWPVGDEAMTMQNPYWVNYRNLRENKKRRYMFSIGLNYKILDWLSVSGRVRLDDANNDYTERFYASTNTQLTEGSNNGLYGIKKTTDSQLYADFLVNINKTFGEDWSLQANIGGSVSDLRSDAMEVRGPIADGGNSFKDEPIGYPNFFAIQNLSANKKLTKRMQEGWREQTQSIFASAEVGYKSTYYLTLTGRNDWPSQLAGPNSNTKSFFYPSVGASVVLTELMPNLNKDYLSYMKLRGSWASVGSPFARFIANPHYEWNQETGQWSTLTQYPLYNLKPERTHSYEIGLTMKFLKYFDLDVTYYNAKTMNQTFNPQLPVSGWSSMYIQTGAVRNQGIELSLGFNKTWNKFTWDTGVTFSTNKNEILTLADNTINPITGETFSRDLLDMGGLGETRFILKEGGSMGDIYSRMDLKRDSNGKVFIDPNGTPTAQMIQDPEEYIKLGSVLPDGNLAWRNNFNWKNIDFGFLVSARLGGVVFSRTQAMLDYYGVSETSAQARDNGYVLVNGNDYINPETWYGVIGSGTSVPQYYTYSATNVRLQELSLGYTLPKKFLKNVCDLRISVVGRNLWMIYNKAPFDPESVASTSNFYQGIDYFIMPSLRNVGVNISLKF